MSNWFLNDQYQTSAGRVAAGQCGGGPNWSWHMVGHGHHFRGTRLSLNLQKPIECIGMICLDTANLKNMRINARRLMCKARFLPK